MWEKYESETGLSMNQSAGQFVAKPNIWFLDFFLSLSAEEIESRVKQFFLINMFFKQLSKVTPLKSFCRIRRTCPLKAGNYLETLMFLAKMHALKNGQDISVLFWFLKSQFNQQNRTNASLTQSPIAPTFPFPLFLSNRNSPKAY